MSENESSSQAEDQTTNSTLPFDFDAYPPDTLFHERRGPAGGSLPDPARASRPRRERRRRVDPTTFEKQYSTDELEFMNAMQRFKVQSGKPFPSHGEVLRVARRLGYAKSGDDAESDDRPNEGSA